MTNKTEAVPLLSKQRAKSIIDSHCDACAARLIECLTQEEQDGLDAIADGRAIVISAADLAAKDAEIERLRLYAETMKYLADPFLQEVTREKIESLRRDAERYRWLRSDADGAHGIVQRHLHTGNPWLPSGNDLDKAIDAAITAAPAKSER